MEALFEFLSHIPSSAWVALSTAILTSTLTLIGVNLTNRASNDRLRIQLDHETETRRNDIIRERLEELYVESKRYMNVAVSHFLPYRQVMAGELTFNDALDITTSRNYEHNPDRLNLIIDMYFPELQAPFLAVKEKLEHTQDVLHGYKQQYKSGDISGEKWLPHFQEALELLAKEASSFEREVSRIAKTI